MLWARFCWETCHPCGCSDPSTVADHVHPFMETVFPDGSGLFQQDNAPCPPPRNLQDEKDLLLTSRCQIPQHTFRGLAESAPRRLRAVLAANGGPTQY